MPLNLTYNRTWDEKSGNFTYKLDWRMPTDVNIQRAIGLFEVVVETIAPDGSNETLHTTTYTTTNVRKMSIYMTIGLLNVIMFCYSTEQCTGLPL